MNIYILVIIAALIAVIVWFVVSYRQGSAVYKTFAGFPVASNWHGLPIPAAEDDLLEATNDQISFILEGWPIRGAEEWFRQRWPPTDFTMSPLHRTPEKIQYLLLPIGQKRDDALATPIILGLYSPPRSQFPPRLVSVVISDARHPTTNQKQTEGISE